VSATCVLFQVSPPPSSQLQVFAACRSGCSAVMEWEGRDSTWGRDSDGGSRSARRPFTPARVPDRGAHVGAPGRRRPGRPVAWQSERSRHGSPTARSGLPFGSPQSRGASRPAPRGLGPAQWRAHSHRRVATLLAAPVMDVRQPKAAAVSRRSGLWDSVWSTCAKKYRAGGLRAPRYAPFPARASAKRTPPNESECVPRAGRGGKPTTCRVQHREEEKVHEHPSVSADPPRHGAGRAGRPCQR